MKGRIKNLQDLAHAQRAEEFLAELTRLATGPGFSSLMEQLRTHRVFLRFRSRSIIQQVRQVLHTTLRPLLPKDQWRGLDDLCVVSHRVQCILDAFDQEANAIPSLAAPPSDFQIAVLFELARRVKETCNTGAHEHTGLSPREAAAAEHGFEQQVRRLWDAANTLIRQNVNLTNHNRAAPTAQHLKDLFELSLKYNLFTIMVDRYTYRDIPTRIRRKAIVFLDHYGDELTKSGTRAAQRTTVRDEVQRAPYNRELGRLRKITIDCASATFEEFFASNTGRNVLNDALTVANIRHGLSLKEVGQYLSLSRSVRTPSGFLTLQTMLDVWKCLLAVCLQARVWQRQHRPHGSVNPAPTLPKHLLHDWIGQTAGLSPEEAVHYVDCFVFREGKTADLFVRPLLPAGEGFILPLPFIEASRVERNIFKILAQDSDLDQQTKGAEAVDTLHTLFCKGGFRSTTNYPIVHRGTKITDADVIAQKGHHLFIGQVKIVIPPDSEHELWEAQNKLKVASQQMRTTLEHLNENLPKVMDVLQVGAGLVTVVPFLLTNAWNFTGTRINGFVVTDLSYVRMILEGAYVEVMDLDERATRLAGRIKLIQGQAPTGEELAKLLENPIHEVMTLYYTPGGYQKFTVGGYNFHIPFQRLTLGDRREVREDTG